jgi:hypothetical protein
MDPQTAKHPPTPYDKASAEDSGHDTISSKASAKEKANDNDGKASVKGEKR